MSITEHNPQRAGLVTRGKPWPWCSLMLFGRRDVPPWISLGPGPRGRDWPRHIAEAQTEAELLALRRSVNHRIAARSGTGERSSASAWKARFARARPNNEA